MADSDPRKSRAYARRAQLPGQSEDDPLVELARIVGEDNNYYGSRTGKAAGSPDDVQTHTPLSANLESELLNELESSLSRGAAEPPKPAPRQIIRPARVQPQPEPEPEDGDELMRSIEEQLGAFERRQQLAQPVDSVTPSQANWAGRNEQLRSRQPEPRAAGLGPGQRDEQDAPRSAPVPPTRRAAQSPVLRAAAAPDPGVSRGGARSEQNAFRGNALRGRGEPNLDEPSSPRSAQTQGSDSFAPSQRQVPLRPDRGAPLGPGTRRVAGWDETADMDDPQDGVPVGWVPEAASGASGLRPSYDSPGEDGGASGSAAASRSAHIEAELSRELESGFSDPTAITNWPEPDTQSAGEPRAVHRAGTYDLDASRKPLRRRRARTGLLALASLLGLAVVGGGVAAYMRAGEAAPSGPPPVIAAPRGAVKVQPPAPQQQAAEETVGEAVYNRVAGAAQPTQEQVVEGAEEPEEISRIVLPPPDPPTPVADSAEPDPTAVPRSAEPETEQNVGPRRVRTYVVRPDGTIVASEEAPAAPAAEPAAEEPPEQQVAAVEAERPAEPARVPVTEINESPEPAGGAAAGTAEAQAPAPDPEPAAAPQAAPAAAEAPAGADAGAALGDLAPSQAPETPAEQGETRPPAADAPAQVASAPAPEAAQPAAAAATGGHFVQVSSQRSMDQAQSSFASMKRQFPSVLGPLSADIQEADLGAKGIYFRVRVGPYATRGEAITVCEQLKAAGGSCIVTQ